MRKVSLSLAISLFFFSSFQSLSFTSPFNASYLQSRFGSLPHSPFFLKDVLKAIAAKEGWNPDEIRVSDIDVRNARIGSAERYEFRLWMGKSDLVFKFLDEISSWEKSRRWDAEFGPHSIGGSGLKRTSIKRFELRGPIDLRIEGNRGLSLALPVTITYSGLQRVLVSEGITVEVDGAQEVTLLHPTNFDFPTNRSMGANAAKSQFWPFSYSACIPLPLIQIKGPASFAAYRTRNPSIPIKTTFPSKDTIKLLPDKCYPGQFHKNQGYPIHSLSSRLALLERLLRSFFRDRILQNRVSALIKSKITASILVRFQLELERDVGNNDRVWDTLASWRTKPKSERVWFEVVARLEAGKLKPLMLKNLRPFVVVDTTAWSNLMSNVSFTQFPSVIVPPEALTLDVK